MFKLKPVTTSSGWASWTAALAGLICGILIGDTPPIFASPDCFDKVECAQKTVSSDTCGTRCNKLFYCGYLTLFVGLGYEIEEVDENGYEDVEGVGVDFCYRKQPCKSEKTIQCPGTPNEWLCENDGDPEDVYAFDEGATADDC